MSKQPPPAPTASAVDPCPTIVQISWTLRSDRTTRPRPHDWTLAILSLSLSLWNNKQFGFTLSVQEIQ